MDSGLQQAQDPTQRSHFLSALARFEDPVLRAEAMAYTLDGPLRPTELFTIPFGGGSSDQGVDRVFDWLLANYDAFTARMPPMFVSLMPRAASGCSLERLAKAQDFFSRAERQVGGTVANLTKVADQVSDCANLRRRDGDAVTPYLKESAATN